MEVSHISVLNLMCILYKVFDSFKVKYGDYIHTASCVLIKTSRCVGVMHLCAFGR